MRKLSFAEKSVDDVLIADTLTGSDHVDEQSDGDREGEFAAPGEIALLEGGVEVFFFRRQEVSDEIY